MKSRKITSAYDGIQPPQETFDAIASRVSAQRPKKRRPLRTALATAACIALFAALGAGGFAAYRNWSQSGVQYAEKHMQTTQSMANSFAENTPVSVQNEPLPDEYFVDKAAELVKQLGKDDVDTGTTNVTRQKDELYDREEVTVTFPESANGLELTFHAYTGELLRLIDLDFDGSGMDFTYGPEALAKEYYAKLPVPQDYQITDWTTYGEMIYSYDFCREVMDGVFSAYECVRIGVNPVSGRLCMVNVFNVPLLDDHKPGDEPLTQAQAEKIAGEGHVPEDYVLASAEIAVVCPNSYYSDAAEPGDARRISRLAWVLIYDGPSEEFSDEIRIYVDYYTGALLGGDATA